MILDPYHMEVTEWTDRLNQFANIGTSTTMKLEDPEKWQAWAMNLVGDPDDIGLDAPDPYLYDDWREWASAFFLTQELT